MQITGAQALIESLKKEGVDLVFGYPGGTVLPIYDVLFKEKDLKHILTRHEQGATHAADGYARSTGKVGVCIATSGPGATNTITGIATAYMDSIPMVVITGQVATNLIGRDSFQEADVIGITQPITKHNYLVKDAADIPRVIKEAFHIARTGRPGPIVVDIAKDAQNNKISFKYPDKVNLPGYNPTLKGHSRQLKAAAKMISLAKKPLIYAGGGIITSGAAKELKEFAIKHNIPVTTTLMGLGAFPEDHKLALQMLGMHGAAYANYAVQECDLLVAIGARFDDRVTGHLPSFAPKAKHIHIDIDPAEIGKNVRIDVPIVGDVKLTLIDLMDKSKVEPGKHEAWLKQIDEWKNKYPLSYKKDKTIKPQYVVEMIREVTKGEAIICTEVGQHQMWAAQYYRFTKPRTWVSSGGLGTMGYGFPAAIGAQFGNPKAIVFDIAGDGSIQMNIQEMATAVNHKLPIKIAVLNNCFLGMVRQWQELLYDKRYSSTNLCNNPDLVKIAKAYGAEAMRITRPEDVKKALKDSLKIKDRPVLMDFTVAKEENVFPFVPPGQAINEMLVD
ncbi:acetolactate synthase, large subunit, biosynthetic type [candidate division WOR-1 bacterium RIFCSPLOWO2_02_FULL_46_20]|uniref:Acetolactate synthase n=2 Tax=Saganbacteria TaxID=1703751 RepID=A0A1F4RBF8_UNCSA|nr:MAG: acetolactate synthase, large subunit, biosynthetic type [candidate division WOR-1 bacterium RIFCSPHIGHO2_02_FULL_45_12]OGC05517.1 MAG: acetolactate synthase, large subunit, biosynthetic type [candidate division WOR-1 bacterium RIFCSPLOWO2_02_FULL_46_20]OGC09198.1 MAG: acetolactate synthase, large subunit, biosynthetic type [candidate division WOR-1 bacterium RIFCSPLOWO2_12_FULL_45_9]